MRKDSATPDAGGPVRTPHRVVVLLLEELVGYDAVIPTQVLGEAHDSRDQSLYDVRMASLDGKPVATTRGYSIVPHGDSSLLSWAQTLVVPGTRMHEPRRDGRLSPVLRAALDLARVDTRMVSICTGAFVLAAAGVLDERPATTHWQCSAELQRLFPRVRVDANVLFTDDGDVLTSAGLSAGIDLCLHLIRRDHGTRVANAVARHCVVPPWRDGGQAQFIERHLPPVGVESTAGARAWAQENLSTDVAGMAMRAGMSPRTFARRFAQEAGESPGAWLLQQRVRRAQELLETTDLSIDQVADRSGIGTPASLRAQFRAHTGVSPSRYRSMFTATA